MLKDFLIIIWLDNLMIFLIWGVFGRVNLWVLYNILKLFFLWSFFGKIRLLFGIIVFGRVVIVLRFIEVLGVL